MPNANKETKEIADAGPSGQKIPDNAKLVFQGKVWNVYQWQQRMFDGTEATFEGLSRNNAVKIFATVGDKVVISKESQPRRGTYYTLLGGVIEKGESPREAAERELREEGGMRSEDWELISIVDVLNFRSIDFNGYIYAARGCVKVGDQSLDAGETVELHYASFADAIKLLSENNRAMLGNFIDGYLLKPENITAIKRKLRIER